MATRSPRMKEEGDRRLVDLRDLVSSATTRCVSILTRTDRMLLTPLPRCILTPSQSFLTTRFALARQLALRRSSSLGSVESSAPCEAHLFLTIGILSTTPD